MNTHSVKLQRRLVASLCCLVGAGGAVCDSSALTLNSGNASADIDPGSQAGMFNWFVDGQDYLAQQQVWYRLNGTASESSVDTLPLSSLTQPTANSATMIYSGAGFDLELRYTLTGGGAGSGMSDISEQLIVRNTSNGQLGLSLFLFSNFDLSGGGDTVTSIPWKPIPFTNPGYDRATQLGGLASETTTLGYFADRAEAGAPGTTLAHLNDGAISTLVNAGVSFGPVGLGDVSYTFQWDLSLANGGSEIIGVDKRLTVVPEPTALSLAVIGLAGLLARSRRSS